MKMSRVTSPKVKEPAPGTWSNCRVHGNQFFVAGMTAGDGAGGVLGDGSVCSQAQEIFIQALDPARWKDIPAGFRIYTLWEHPETGASIALFSIPKGGGVPTRHVHASNQFMYCLKGKYEYTTSGLVLTPGTFYMNP